MVCGLKSEAKPTAEPEIVSALGGACQSNRRWVDPPADEAVPGPTRIPSASCRMTSPSRASLGN
jgi:hypothetical protein